MSSGSVAFLAAVIAYPRSYVRKEGIIFTQSIMAGEAWRQELEAADHTATTLRKQRAMDSGAQLPFYS